ncbi:MAG: exodeoxyribonuclease III [Sneathiellaceae bacterium]
MFKIATWNVNSVRLRADGLQRLIAEQAPDVICLQETKVANPIFPLQVLHDAGYPHVSIHGQKMYNGVAIAARRPFLADSSRLWCEQEDCRHISATFEDGLEVHNFYIPAGGDLPDPEVNPKFAHKLRFVDEITDWFGRRRGKKTNRLVLVGDLNIAPLETDVWSHKQLLKVVSHTPVEVAAMDRMYRSHDWVDAVRTVIPPEEKLFSWWSYRSPDWDAADKGRRLDHIWVTPALKGAIRNAQVLRHMRGLAAPSDHAPVVAELDL